MASSSASDIELAELKHKRNGLEEQKAAELEREKGPRDLILRELNKDLDRVQAAITALSSGPCLWTVLCQPVVDDLYGNHAPSQTFPSHGGRTADTIGKWDSFAADLQAWAEQCNLQSKLNSAVLATKVVNQLHSEHQDTVDFEWQLYPAICVAIYDPVNQAAEILGLPLRYSGSRGQHGNTLVDLRARHTTSEMTYVPHEVKAPWAEKHNGRHFADLLRHEETRPTVARPSAQILSYMVEEGAMYGIISSKVNHVFVRRPPSSTSRHVDFTEVFNSERQLQPPVRLMYLYMLHLASTAEHLDPAARPSTAPADKWVKSDRKRARQSDEAAHDEDDDDAGDSDNTAGAAPDGPARHTRSKSTRHNSSSNGASKGSSASARSPCKSRSADILSQLCDFERSSLQIGAPIVCSHSCVVRQGTWQGLAAVYKVWDLGDSLEPLLDLQAEVEAYCKLLLLQGVRLPKLLGHGQIHEGLHAFIATSAGRGTLTWDMLQDCPAWAHQAKHALAAIHQQGMLHGDLALRNFVISEDGHCLWLVDLVDSRPGSLEERALETRILDRLLTCCPEHH